MGSHTVVVPPEFLDLVPGIVESHKPVLVEALVTKLTVEALDNAILDRLSRPDEIQPNPMAIGPRIECSAGKLGSVVHHQADGLATLLDGPFQDPCDPLTGQRGIDFDRQALPDEVIDHIERSEAPTCG